MIYRCEKETTFSFSILPPLYLPFQLADFTVPGGNTAMPYYYYKPFTYDPANVWTSATGGSPVIIAEQFFAGFLNDCGGTFSYDGAVMLTVKAEPGQEVFVCENGDPFAAWKEYNDIAVSRRGNQKTQKFWYGLEYCTWVEQKREAANLKIPAQEGVTEDFIYRYMKRIEALGLPKGKLTIDDGWDQKYDGKNRRILGDWEIDRRKFPHFEKMISDMTAAGFIPGMWFAPFIMTDTCKLAQKRPDLLGHTWSYDPRAEAERGFCYIEDDECLDEYYYDVFAKYVKMGVRKFKLDYSYGPKRHMTALLARIYRAIKSVDETVEVECHIPDIYAANYADSVRLNDVLFDNAGKWRNITVEHYRVCKYSSFKVLNLDHLGTNTPFPDKDDYLNHTKIILSLGSGYPCVSLLPDNFDKETETRFVEMINKWENDNKCRINNIDGD